MASEQTYFFVDLNPMESDLEQVLIEGDLESLKRLAAAGADLVNVGICNDNALSVAIECNNEPESRHAVIRCLSDLRLDPNVFNIESGGPLLSAIHHYDTEAVRLLLGHGAGPQLKYEDHETFYDYALGDYQYDFYGKYSVGIEFPEKPSEADRASKAAWLAFLDRLALKYGKPRPEYLMLLLE